MDKKPTWLDRMISETVDLQDARLHLLYQLEMQSRKIQELKDELRSIPPISDAVTKFTEAGL